jgi:hypothetical protein
LLLVLLAQNVPAFADATTEPDAVQPAIGLAGDSDLAAAVSYPLSDVVISGVEAQGDIPSSAGRAIDKPVCWSCHGMGAIIVGPQR